MTRDLPPDVEKAQLLIGAYLMSLPKKERRAAMQALLRRINRAGVPGPARI
jgi:hypothetical protein